MDATHPQHNPVLAGGWIKRGEEPKSLFKQLEAIHLTAVCLYVICDNARYYRSKAVQEYLETSRIKLVFLPPYAPNHLIERFWKFLKKNVLYNRYYETVR